MGNGVVDGRIGTVGANRAPPAGFGDRLVTIQHYGAAPERTDATP